jgi:ribosomal protein S9
VCRTARVPSQRTAVAVAYCKRGKGSIKLNGCPIELIEPEILRLKVGRIAQPLCHRAL